MPKRALALMVTVLAKPTMGGRSGNGQCRCLIVYPDPRRCGATISMRLHTVGVSIDRKKSKCSLLGLSLMAASPWMRRAHARASLHSRIAAWRVLAAFVDISSERSLGARQHFGGRAGG